jgi:hypothetical protein
MAHPGAVETTLAYSWSIGGAVWSQVAHLRAVKAILAIGLNSVVLLEAYHGDLESPFSSGGSTWSWRVTLEQWSCGARFQIMYLYFWLYFVSYTKIYHKNTLVYSSMKFPHAI